MSYSPCRYGSPDLDSQSSLAPFLFHQCNPSAPSYFGTYHAWPRPGSAHCGAPSPLRGSPPLSPLDVPAPTFDTSSVSRRDSEASTSTLSGDGESDEPAADVVDVKVPRKRRFAAAQRPPAGSTTTTKMKHPCELCNSKFSRPSALAAHVFSHTKEQNYSCYTCGKAFSISSNMRRHGHTQKHPVYEPFVSLDVQASPPSKRNKRGATRKSSRHRRV